MPSFSWSRWLRSFVRPESKTRRGKSRRASVSHRPRLEALEAREAPATHTWTGADGNGSWKDAGNWTGGAPTGVAANADALVFPSGVASLTTTNDLPLVGGAAPTISSITFSGSGYTLLGSKLTLGVGTVFGSGTVTVGTNITGTTIGLDVQMAAPATSNQLFTVNSGADLTISGHIGGTSGSSLTKEGSGTLILTNDNSSFTGPIKLDNNAGVVQITNANALGSTASPTTVGQNSQLQVKNVVGTINEPLLLNGPGLTFPGDTVADGALLNVAGNNVWGGNIELDNDTFIGAVAGSLNITGQISDNGSGHNLTKRGSAQIIFSHVGGNTYRGITEIDNGILTIRDPLALGEPRPGGATPSAANGTIVESTLLGVGTLQLEDPTGVGFIVQDEQLTLNGSGSGSIGALNNLNGNNTWAGSILLGSVGGSSPTIGIDANTTLTVTGVISSPTGIFNLNKSRPGELILTNSNTYTGTTTVANGILNIRDSQALGQNGGAGTTVFPAAALELQVDTGFDSHGRDLSIDSVTGLNGNGPQLGLTIATNINLTGTGVANAGALHSISGINVLTGTVTLNGTVALGVNADPNASNTNSYFTHDYSLTVTNGGTLTGGSLTKVDAGQLILPHANPFGGTTDIQQGWITIEDINALGPVTTALDQLQVPITVENGGALHFKPPDATTNFDFVRPLILSGLGIAHPFPLINQKGAVMMLGGNDMLGGPVIINNISHSSYIELNGVAGIGVELLDPATVSSLVISSTIADFPGTHGGLTKLGSRFLTVLGSNTYSGPTDIAEGAANIQNSAALGVGSTGTASSTATETYTPTTTTIGPGIAEVQSFTVAGAVGTYTLSFNGQGVSIATTATAATVQSALNSLSTIGSVGGSVTVSQVGNVYTVTFGGTFVGINQPQLIATAPAGITVAVTTLMNGDGTALELGTTTAHYDGGVTTGLDVWNENLILNSPGSTLFGDLPLVVFGNDNLWQGNVSLDRSLTLDIQTGARLTIAGTIDDAANPSPNGSDLTMTGGGDLLLAGANTYAGTTFVKQGTLTIANSQALGGTGFAEVQTLTTPGTTGTFTLSFNGSTPTSALNLASSTLATDVQTALNALATIGGVGGSVTVTQVASVLTVTFGGNLFGFNQPLLVVGGNPGVTAGTLVDGGGGTIVANGAALQLEGGLTVAGEPLILNGNGTAASSNVPLGWFSEGPSPINNGQTAGNDASTGRVTGVVPDPTDPAVIYISTAAGGVWKTENDGMTWFPLFDLQNGQAEVQSVTVTGTTSADTFALTFTGPDATGTTVSDTTIALPYNAAVRDVQAALDALSNIGGVGGSVTVTLSGNVYTITFADDLSGVNVAQMTTTVTGAATATVATIADGIPSDLPMYIGTIVMDPTNDRTLYIGTGEANNSPDSFYGTGIYKSVDAGYHWTLVADNQVQTVTVSGTPTGTFTLTFNGISTGDLPYNDTAADVAMQLNGLSSIGGVGGSVSVVATVNQEVQTLTLAGTGNFVLGFEGQSTSNTLTIGAATIVADIQTGLNALSKITAVGGVTVTASNIANVYFITFSGTQGIGSQPLITAFVIPPAGSPPPPPTGWATVNELVKGNVQYAITFGGTMALTDEPLITTTSTPTTNTASVAVTTPANPFFGKGIAKIIFDPTNSKTLYVADSDGGANQNEIESVTPNNLNGQTFTLTFTGPDATGTIVSWTTAPIFVDPFSNANTATNIQNALNDPSSPNIFGIGGFVSVTLTPGGRPGRPPRPPYLITFLGALSDTNVQQLTSNPGPPTPTTPRGTPTVSISTKVDGGRGKVVNGTSGGAGVWRFLNGVWFDLTDVVSDARQSIGSTQLSPPFLAPPKTPGPDDNYLISFPQVSATWSDVAIVYTDITNTGAFPPVPVLYAALGISDGNSNNGVFWTENPTSNNPIWYVGDPGNTTAGPFLDPASAPTQVDSRSGGFPYGGVDGNIKIQAFAGGTLASTTVYAAVASSSGPLLGVYKSTNGGKTWSALSTPNYMGSEGGYANAFVAPNVSTLYVGGYEISNVTHAQHILKSTDGGTTWTDISIGSDGNGPHTADHALALDSQGRLLVGNDGGVWRLNQSNGIWTDLNGNLTISQVNGVAANPTDLTSVFAGVQSNGVDQFSNGLAWNLVDANGNSGGQVRIDPNNPNNVYAVVMRFSGTATIDRSTDGGQTWTSVLNTSSQTAPLAIDPVNTSRIFAGGVGLFESPNGGTTWIGRGAPITVSALAIAGYQGPFVADPGFPLVVDKGANSDDPDTFYVTDGTNIYVTKNHGASWANRTTGTALDGLGHISDLEVDPGNHDTIYATRNVLGGQQVFMSTDAGQDWTDITNDLPNLPVWKLVLDPRSGDLYVGTDEGVYYLASSSTHWQQFGAGMPNVQVRDLELNPITNALVAGTYGRGVYVLFLDNGQANAGALRALGGSSIWTGPVLLVGDPTTNTVTISVVGTQDEPNGLGAVQLNIIGSISDLTAGSNPTLAKIGGGNLILSGANTYGGVTDLQQGLLIVDNPNALGASGPAANTFVEAGTALELQSDLQLEPITVFGDGILFNGHNTGALRNVSSNNTYTGALTLATDSTIGVDTGTTLTIGAKAGLLGTGTIADGGGASRQLTKELTGTLVLASPNTYSGKTEVNQGALQVQDPKALGSTASGTDVLDGAQLQLQAPSGSSSLVVSGEALTLSGTGIFNTGALLDTGGNTTWQGPITFESNAVQLLPPTNPPTFASIPPTTIAIGTVNLGDNLTINGVISQSGGTFGLDKVGAGRVTLAAGNTNTYGGLTTVDAGALRIQSARSLGTTAQGTLVNGGAVLEVDGNPTGTGTGITVSNETLTLNGNGLAATNAGAFDNVSGYNTWAGTVLLQTNNSIGVEGTTQLSISGTVADAPEVQALTVSGTAGTFTLSFNGVAIASALPVTATATNIANALNPLSTIGGVGGSVSVTETTTTAGNVFTITFGGTLASQNVPQLATAATGGATATAITVLQGPVPASTLTKVGTGTLAFTNTNTYAGKTFVNNGILNIQNASALGNSPPERQTVTVLGASGTFNLVFNGKTTSSLDVNSPTLAADMQSALDALSTIGGVGGSVTVTEGAGTNSNIYTVDFGGSLSLFNLPQMTSIVTPGITATVTTVRDGPEGTVVNSGGTLQVQGGITVSTEALTLNGMGFNNGGALQNATGNNTWANPITLGSNAAIGAGVAEVQTVTIANATGTFNFKFNSSAATPDLSVGATAQQVQDALNALSTIGGVGGSVTVTQSGNVYVVVFGGTLQGSNQLALVAAGTAGPVVATVTDGAGAGNTLVVNQPIGDGGSAFSVTKVGAGTLDYAGGAGTGNTYTGLTQVNQGTLLLDKSGGASALNGNLTVGDGLPGAATARWKFNNQVPDTATVTVNSDGTADLNGQTDTIGPLVISDGTAQTGAGTLTVASLKMTGGTLTAGVSGSVVLGGDVTATSSAAGPAVINGGGSLSENGATRTFTVNAGAQAVDLDVQAVIVPGSGSPGLTKKGNGVMQIDSISTGYGTTTIDAGTVLVDGSIGGATLTAGALLVNGTAGNVSLNAANPGDATLGGTGTVGTITDVGAAVGGTVNPGNGTGTLHSGAVTWNAGTTYDVDLTKAAGNNLLSVTGNVSLNGATLGGVVDPAIAIGQSFTIITVTSGTLDGTQFAQGTTAFLNGQKYNITYNSTSVVLTAVKLDTTLTLTSSAPSGSVYGQDVSFTATLTPEPGGNPIPDGEQVTFTLDSTNYTATLIGGKAVLDVVSATGQPLAVTTGGPLHTISVSYAGDADYNASNIPSITQAVGKATTAFTITQDVAAPVYGQTTTVTVTIAAVSPGAGFPTGPTGQIHYSIDGSNPAVSPLTASLTQGGTSGNFTGVAKFTVDGLNDHQIRISYAGDGNFLSVVSTTNYLITIGKADTNVVVTGPATAPAYGQSVVFTATLSAKSPGSGTPADGDVVTFLDGTSAIGTGVLSGGVATTTVSNLSAGAHTINAQFSGDTHFNAGSGSLASFTVNQASTSTALASSANPSDLGTSVTFTATVTTLSPGQGTPVGSVTFVVDTMTQGSIPVDGSGKASISRTLGLGTHTVTVTFGGNSNFAGSGPTSLTQTVHVGTGITLSPTTDTTVYGQPATFTATVTATNPAAGTPTGSVTFALDSVNQPAVPVDATGHAKITFPALSVAGHTITASFSGTNGFTDSGPASATETVSQAASSIALVSTPPLLGQPITYTATVSPVNPSTATPTGQVTFVVDSVSQTPTNIDAKGQLSITLTSLGLGSHTVTASYGATTNFAASGPATLTQEVKAATTIAIASSANPSVYGQPVTYTATVSALIAAAGTPTGSVTFAIDGVNQLTVGLDGNGQATFTPGPLSAGGHSITAAYNPTGEFVASGPVGLGESINFANATTTVTSSPPFLGQPIVFTATVTAVSPSTAVPAGSVTFVVDGVNQGPVALDANGQASLTVNGLTRGNHTVTATFSGGGFAASAPSQPLTEAVVSNFTGTPTDVFINEVYLDLLNRPVDPANLSFWDNQIETGSISRTQMVLAILNGQEYQTDYITNLYNNILHRAPLLTDIQIHLGILAGGATLEQETATFLGSTESILRNGLEDPFVYTNYIFQYVLGHPASLQAQQWGVGYLQTHSTVDLALQVLSSPEYQGDFVNNAYATLLGHGVPASAAPNPWFMALQNGATDQQVLAGIAGSQEYFSRLQPYQQVAGIQSWLNHAFIDLLGRPIDPQALALYTGAMQDGVSRDAVTRSFVSSPEYRTRVLNTIYENLLNRPIDPASLNLRLGQLAAGATVEGIKADVMGSAEYYFGHGGGTAFGFLNAVYLDSIGLPVDPVGLSIFGTELAAGLPRDQVALGVLETPNALGGEVAQAYLATLRRSTDIPGVLYYAGQVQLGLRSEILLADLVATPEYYFKFANG